MKTFVREYKDFIHPWKAYKPTENPNDNKLMIDNTQSVITCTTIIDALKGFREHIKSKQYDQNAR